MWLRTDLRGGPFGDNLDPQFNELRPSDGHMVVYQTAISLASNPIGATVPAQLDIRSRIYDQNHGPEFLVALLHYRKDTYTLLPLNYNSNDTAHAENVPLGPLSVVYDSQAGKYLLYVPRVSFTTPSWDKSIASWQHYYVWWLDAKTNKIQRTLLPPGPWVSDAKLDIVLGRAFKNFSCGVGCYRHAEITRVEDGVIYVTVTGRPSAISSSALGTYKLSGGAWVKQ